MALAMWFWVQHIAIPHQESDAATLGIPRGNLSDLYPRWLGARELLLHGRDPYSPEITREIQAGYYGRPLDACRLNDPRDQQAFAYPVYVVFVLAPTVHLPFPTVQRSFLCLLVIATAASVVLWMRVLAWRPSLAITLAWIVLALGSFPAIQGFKLQQLTLLVAVLLAASVCLIVRGHLFAAGILLALTTIKPQLALLPVLWLGIWVMGNWRARQRLFWSFAGSMAVLFAASEWILPGWLGRFRAASAAYYQYTGGGRSVLDVLLPSIVGKAAALILVIVCIALVWQIRREPADTPGFRWSLVLVMATTLAVIPMFAPYNQLLLMPCLLEIFRTARFASGVNRLSRFLFSATGLVVVWPWLAAALLTIALVFLPASTVQRAWVVPLYTSLAIPVMVLALVLQLRTTLRSGVNAAR